MDFKLDQIGLGAVSERFEDEMVKVIENVLDPNTDVKKAREITIKLKVKPYPEDREMCEMEAIVSSKLAPTKTLISTLHVGMSEHGEVNAVENVPQQGGLFPEQEQDDSPKDNIHVMHG